MAWAKAGTPDTLTVTGNALVISDLTGNKFNMFLSHIVSKTTNQGIATTLFNSSGGNDYAQRKSINGASDGTDVSQSAWYDQSVRTDTDDSFQIHQIINIDGEEKLVMEWAVNANTAGSSNAPERLEFVGKYDTSTNSGQFSRIDLDGSSGTMGVNSNLSALGSDGTEALNVQDGAIYYETDTNKEFLLSNNTWTEL